MNSERTKVFTFHSNNTKLWADYKDDEPLPIIPWAHNIKSQTNIWITVQSKKKKRY
jgi:hypothetical protein